MRLRSLLAAALLLAACGGGGEQQTTQPTADTSAPVPDILDFTAETVRGEQVAGADYAGQDLVLWFWAPW